MSTKHTPTVKDLVEHLQIADAHMRKLSGVLWHQNMMQEHAEIANEIKRGESLLEQLKGTQGNLIDAAPVMLEALRYADKLIPIARCYFPKSVKKSDTFQLELTCATIGKAIYQAEGGAA